MNPTITSAVAVSQTNSKTHVTCNGDGDGAIDFTISGGSAPYEIIVGQGLQVDHKIMPLMFQEEATKLQALQVVIMMLQLLMITVVF